MNKNGGDGAGVRARALSKKCKNLLGSINVLYLIGHLHAYCVTPLTLTVNLKCK